MGALVAIACVAAAFGGYCLAAVAQECRQSRLRKRAAKSMAAAGERDEVRMGGSRRSSTPIGRVLRFASRPSYPAWLCRLSGFRLWGVGLADTQLLLAQAGLPESASDGTVRIARISCAGAGAVAGVLCGAILSTELSVLLGVLGSVGGFCWMPFELRRMAAERTTDMERYLSGMVEVVVLGLRSGLSFERSFRLYPKYFDTELGCSMSRVASRWEVGLVSREKSLRALEREYDSALLSRVVGSMIRSLRFGTSIADSLESVAVEARETHRARMEERVAKVAVKMMLPVGTLILPAMLLLVLGPVLLELVEGF